MSSQTFTLEKKSTGCGNREFSTQIPYPLQNHPVDHARFTRTIEEVNERLKRLSRPLTFVLGSYVLICLIALALIVMSVQNADVGHLWGIYGFILIFSIAIIITSFVVIRNLKRSMNYFFQQENASYFNHFGINFRFEMTRRNVQIYVDVNQVPRPATPVAYPVAGIPMPVPVHTGNMYPVLPREQTMDIPLYTFVPVAVTADRRPLLSAQY
eukprot:TRINITY_DN4172_c0_g1_i3.p1 TRINITY_DN4172_c0_g1~~TRINITY_DN4172_c0_g1_i3.p1  ORF type:complete len:212 (+),score=31.39 TRINITY_DN4172_c0_g1_i3:38-673(+)